MRVAALDLGSNTSILLVADVVDGRLTRVVRDETTVTRLGAGVHQSRRFDPAALARVDEALGRYAEIIRAENCARVIAVATSAARDVTNADELIAIGRRHRIPIHVIPGAREAELTFLGAGGGLANLKNPVVIDVGGGSTEIIGMRNGRAVGESVDVGSVRVHDLFVTKDPPDVDEMARVDAYAARAFAAATLPREFGDVIAVAGTPTTLATVDQGQPFDEHRVHGHGLSLARIEAWQARFLKMSAAERAALPGMPPKRADVVVCGTSLLLAAMRALGCAEVVVSTRGVRYGVALAAEQFPG